MKRKIKIHLPAPHPRQVDFLRSPAKRKVIRAGRRGGKTVGIAILAVEQFLAGRRILYAAPTTEQVARFWSEVTRALEDGWRSKPPLWRKNESEHFIERPGTENRIKAKTAWNADTLRGDYADLLIFDEFQLIAEDAWDSVGAPMLLDNDGDAVFIFTPPSLYSRSASKAIDPQHANKFFKAAAKKAKSDPGRWATFHFSSMDNPHLSRDALDEIVTDMTSLAYRMEILAEDVDEAPGALWTRKIIDLHRVSTQPPNLHRIVVAVDPSLTSAGDEAGIMVCGIAHGPGGVHGYLLEDCTTEGSPLVWSRAAVAAFHRWGADCIVAEKNQGGEMVGITIQQAASQQATDQASKSAPDTAVDIPVRLVHASRGKYVRAEPVSARSEKGFIHHVGHYPPLEDELCLWVPGDRSPNRLDAFVWGFTDLMLSQQVFSGLDIDACAVDCAVGEPDGSQGNDMKSYGGVSQ